MSKGHPLEKVIAAYGEAWNSHDIERIVAMHTEDSVFENHTSGGRGVGKAAIREILKGIFAAFPDLRFDARRTYARDGVVTQEWTATGTLAIPYASGSTTVQPTGRKVSWNGVRRDPLRRQPGRTQGRLRRLDGFPARAGLQARGLVKK